MALRGSPIGRLLLLLAAVSIGSFVLHCARELEAPQEAEWIEVSSPREDTSWTVGTTGHVRWTSRGTSGTVCLDVSSDSAQSWLAIAPEAPDIGSYAWTVTGTACSYCVLRVRDVDGQPTGISKAFRILLPAPALVEPDSGTTTQNRRPYFGWADAPGATSYRLQIDSGTAFSSPHSDTVVTVSEYVPHADLSYGTHWWRVCAGCGVSWSAWSAPWSVMVTTTIGVPLLTQPSAGDTLYVAMPYFGWSDVPGATKYEITIGLDSLLSNPEVQDTTVVSEYQQALALPAERHYWRVRAGDGFGWGAYAGPQSFVILNGIGVPVLDLPPDGSTTYDRTPFLRWYPLVDAERYRVEIAADSDFVFVEVADEVMATELTVNEMLALGTHYWRVRAGVGSLWGQWTSPRSFIVSVEPGVPELLSPADGATLQDQTPSLTWSSILGATSYAVQVADNTAFVSPLMDAIAVDTTATVSPALVSGAYYWHVRAGNGLEWGDWSDHWQFLIATVPAVPGLVWPDSGAIVESGVPTFDWTDVEAATGYQLQVDNTNSFALPIEIDVETTLSTYTPLDSLIRGRHYWRVRAGNDQGWSAWTNPWSFTFPGPTLLDMVSLPGGAFMMGFCDSTGAGYDQQPVHEVTLSPFSISRYEVTQEQYALYDPSHGSEFQNTEGPVENVSWFDAARFCNWLSRREGHTEFYVESDWSCNWTADGYRLPTEAEWEYACRGGTTSHYYGGDTDTLYNLCEPLDPTLDPIAWYCGNTSAPHEVGGKTPNAFGLYDTSGNVYEWCNDWYLWNYYEYSPSSDPPGPESELQRVNRGGSWYGYAMNCRSAARAADDPGVVYPDLGFRVVRRGG
ncbi:formylglycine-generating enzyme family protein [Candidatus Fermentibacteria bacterium]|nr:formylglycine-generating enzyme family protein [Candidatus Fermentibacteria bacterium]